MTYRDKIIREPDTLTKSWLYFPTCHNFCLQTPTSSTLSNSVEKHVHLPPLLSGPQNSKIQMWLPLMFHYIAGVLQEYSEMQNARFLEWRGATEAHRHLCEPCKAVTASCLHLLVTPPPPSPREPWFKPTWMRNDHLSLPCHVQQSDQVLAWFKKNTRC